MKRDFNKINVVYCPKDAKYFGQYTEAKKCKDCCFCETIDKDGVNCIYDAGIFMKRMHVTSFTHNGYNYISQNTNSLPKEKLNEIDDACDLCCFNKQLSNGKMICLLRHSSNDDETSAFICYENEYWIKEKIEDND